MRNNTIMKILVSTDISKEESGKLHTIEDVRNYVINTDSSPSEHHAYRLDEYMGEEKAKMSCNDFATADVFESKGVKYLHVGFTCLEMYNTDEDGDFIDGSDYDDFADFTEEQTRTILDFIS